MINQDNFTLEPEVMDVEINEAKLDSWLLENINIMEELSVFEPTSWREVDTPG